MSSNNKRIHYRIDLPSVCGKDVKCNLSCSYCHKDFFPVNAEFDESAKNGFADTIELLEKIHNGSERKRKIHFSGRTEPLFMDANMLKCEISRIHARFPDFEKIMTTNGLLLEERAALIREAGINRVNVSVHNGSFRSAKFRRGIEAAKNAGLGVVLNSIIDDTVIGNLEAIIGFAREHSVNVKFFPLLNLSPEETAEITSKAVGALTDVCGTGPVRENGDSRLVFKTGKSVIALKISESEDEMPDACRRCRYKSACTEGCRESIRITPWYIKPCGVREDNVVYLKNADETKLKKELINAGKI